MLHFWQLIYLFPTSITFFLSLRERIFNLILHIFVHIINVEL